MLVVVLKYIQNPECIYPKLHQFLNRSPIITLFIIGTNYEEQRAISCILTRPLSLTSYKRQQIIFPPSNLCQTRRSRSLTHPEAMSLCVLTIEIKNCHPWRIQKRRERESGASRGAHRRWERGKAKITPLDTTNFTMCIIALWWKSLHLNIRERRRMGDRETRRECHYFVCGAFETLIPEKWLLLNEILVFLCW